MAISGPALAFIGAGTIFMYSGIKGTSVLAETLAIIQGKTPVGQPQTNPIIPSAAATTSDNTSNSTISTGSVPDTNNAKQALKNAAAAKGWDTGAEWTALDAIEMQEAGYNPTNTNPSSKAYGLAQSLGHGFAGGPASNGINEYGGYGLTPDQSRSASSGDPTYQAVWMVNYIASRYGDPIAAEKFHLQNNWY